MKIAAIISQGIVALLTFLAFAKLPVGAYSNAGIPFAVLLCSVFTIVALIRPFGRGGRLLALTVNALFLLLCAVAFGGLIYYQLRYGSQPIVWGVLAIVVFCLPYSFSLL